MRVTPTSYFAEYVGAFFFILAIFVSMGNPLVIGGALALVIYLIADVSGGHVNPAVSVAMTLNGGIKPMELLGYAAAQVAGGASAYYAFKALKH
jgi:glycerol uptake facilitator-like aquaporin